MSKVIPKQVATEVGATVLEEFKGKLREENVLIVN
jgi:hypothetical protein